MFTNNYTTIVQNTYTAPRTSNIQSTGSATTTTTLGSQYPGIVPLKDYRGNIVYISPLSVAQGLNSPMSTGNINTSSYGWKFGSGTTAPTPLDYTLENAISSGFSSANAVNSATYDPATGIYKHTLTWAVPITSSTPITVSEIGLFAWYKVSNTEGGTSSTDDSILLFRETFTPVTLGSGDILAIKFTSEFPNPSSNA